MASLVFHVISSAGLFSYGLYHLVLATKAHLKSPSNPPASKPYHPLPASSSASHFIKHLPLYLLLLSLSLAVLQQSILSTLSDPLYRIHRISSLQSLASLLFFLLLALSLLLPNFPLLHIPRLPPDLFFALASAAFAIHSSVARASTAAFAAQSFHLQSKCDAVSFKISAAASALCAALAFDLRLFVAELALAASFCLQGLWVLQTGLSLYADGFIPEGCHRLLDVVRGVEGSTECDLEDSQVRAVAILDLVFIFYLVFVAVIVLVVYASVVRASGMQRVGSYEALPTVAAAPGVVNSNHVQMKAMTNTQE
ncbi:hypothetical protein ACLOJK_038925 [Asimina triloba]